MNEPRWYCLSREGMATLCTGKADAEMTAINADELYPRAGPHRAVQLVEAAPQPQQAAPAGLIPVDGAVWGMYAQDAVFLTQRGSENERIAKSGGERMYRLAATPPQGAPAPQRKALTDEQIKIGRWATSADPDDWPESWAFEQGVRFAERAHNIPQPDCEQEKTR